MNLQPFLIGDGWMEVLDGNPTARDLFTRHYSNRHRRRGRKQPALIVGPGRKLLLITADAGAVCSFRLAEIRQDEQTGVECNIFRREAGDLASTLLAGAMQLAWSRFPGERLFSFVAPREVRPTMLKGPRGHLYPVWGYCFYQAGWRFCGLTKKGLHILECRPEWVACG